MAICKECGTNVADSSKFCTKCGAPMKSTAASAKKEAAPQASYAANESGQADVMSTLGWVGVIILYAVPLVGLIVYIVWAFSSTGNRNLRNYTRASLIITAVFLVLGIIMGIVVAIAGTALFGSFGSILDAF